MSAKVERHAHGTDVTITDTDGDTLEIRMYDRTRDNANPAWIVWDHDNPPTASVLVNHDDLRVVLEELARLQGVAIPETT